jgi:DNA-binding NtrC family response regulator
MGDDPRKLVFFVDDDEDLRSVMRILLDEEGYRFAEASSLEEARAFLGETMPDVMVLDMVLGAESGRDLLRELAFRKDGPVTVLISGVVDLIEIAMEYGNLPIVRKPFDVDHLMSAMDRAIETGARPRFRRISAA